MTCPRCSHINPSGARFCSNCGTPLSQAAPAASRPAQGERKLVTVLFADVVDSTRLAERAGAEEWAEIMNGAFAFMNAAVTGYGGTVGRLMGDAILAFFGAPLAHEDDAERAVRCALEIIEKAEEYSLRLRSTHPNLFGDGGFEVRVGINSGLSVLATVGDEIKAEYTAMGDTANLAARLQGLAAPGTVLIGHDTYALVRHVFEIAPLGAREVRGKDAPIAVYEVTGLSANRARRRGIDGLVSPLVGRDGEMARLRERLDRLTEGQGGFVTIVGEAGLGKSRLVAELRRRGRSGGDLRWIEGRALSYAQAVPFFPWRGAILASLDATDAEPPRAIRQRLRAKLAGADGLSPEHGRYLEVLLAVEDEATDAEIGELDGGSLGSRITAAAIAYLRWLAAAGPLVVVFEDLHWADPASVELLVSAAEHVSDAPLLLLSAMRPDRQAPSWGMLDTVRWRAGDAFLDVRLEPLNEAGSRELLTNLLVVRDLPPATSELILSRSDGNPFYLEEVLRSLIDSGHIVREGSLWRARSDIVEATIPDTLSGVLSARIDRLPEQTRHVAQTAAVIGRTFGSAVLGSVLEDDPIGGLVGELSPHLDTLTMEELVRELRLEPEPEYSFKHALTQEAAYDRLLLRRRRELHRRVGLVLERLYAGRSAEIAPVLAHHFSRGEEWEAAARYAAAAAQRARLLYSLPEALRLYEEAVTALGRLEPATSGEAGAELRQRHELHVDSLLGWLDSAVHSRLHERLDARAVMVSRGDKAVALARGLDDRFRLAKSLVAQGSTLVLSGSPFSGFGPLLEAHGVAVGLGNDDVFLLPFWVVTEVMVADDPTGAAEQFLQVAEMARRVGNKSVESHALGTRAMALARIGEFARSLEAIPQALEAADESGSVIKVADVNMLVGDALVTMGEVELGLQYIAYGTNKALSIQGLECASSGFSGLGSGKLQSSMLDQAVLDFDRSLEIGAGTGIEVGFYNVRASRATCRFRQGDVTAVDEIEAQLKHAETMNDGLGIAFAVHELANANIELGRLERAEAQLRQALALYRRRAMKPAVVKVLQTLATLQEKQARRVEAARLSAEADEIERMLRVGIDRVAIERLRAAAPHLPGDAVARGV